MDIFSNRPLYDPSAVQFMRDELTAIGFDELFTPEDVDRAINTNNDETVLVFINSVCGCAAGSARPGFSKALQNERIPNRITTVFAGQEKAAVARVRDHWLNGQPPSSPSAALFKNGELVFMVHRHEIERHDADEIAEHVKTLFDQHCTGVGPSVPAEHLFQVNHAKTCGSKIPKYEG
ncbi:MAG: BrxA/BrxB family bacilliredoxin [Calditrichaeota bacterium]|nr:MAG: BrxA/BrxB family bacilliredoxin [Calditrichota bacterium]